MKRGRLPGQFARKLKQFIASEVYKVGTVLPSMDRLHRDYGLSKTTIITALKILREEGIIQKGKASRNGYMIIKKPDDSTEFSRAIGNKIVKINMPFSFWNTVGNKLLESLEFVFTAHGFKLLFSNNNNSVQEETRFLQDVLSQENQIANALILMTGDSFQNPNVKLLNHLHSHLPVIFLDRYIPNVRSHYVGADNHEIGFQATQYLLSKGHNRIGFITYMNHLSTVNDRFSGYLMALMQRDIYPVPQHIIRKRSNLIDVEHIKSWGKILGEEILALEKRPTAWLCGSDKEAVGLIDFFQKQGYNIPDDIAFIGCDSDEFLLHDKDYTLTSFEYPYTAIANEIYQLAVALTRVPSLPYKKVEFAAQFIEGDTA